MSAPPSRRLWFVKLADKMCYVLATFHRQAVMKALDNVNYSGSGAISAEPVPFRSIIKL